eukprot:299235-Amorphochlora_amoeboformis.AAC.1
MSHGASMVSELVADSTVGLMVRVVRIDLMRHRLTRPFWFCRPQTTGTPMSDHGLGSAWMDRSLSAAYALSARVEATRESVWTGWTPSHQDYQAGHTRQSYQQPRVAYEALGPPDEGWWQLPLIWSCVYKFALWTWTRVSNCWV